MSEQEHSSTLPGVVCMQHYTKLAISEDKPVLLDYWVDSLVPKILIGIRDNGEKLLVKSAEEYTSPISKIFKIENEYIVVTENSIYVVSAKIPTRKISS